MSLKENRSISNLLLGCHFLFAFGQFHEKLFTNKQEIAESEKQMIFFFFLYIYKSRVTVFVASNLRNGWIIFNETLHTPYGGMRIGFKT